MNHDELSQELEIAYGEGLGYLRGIRRQGIELNIKRKQGNLDQVDEEMLILLDQVAEEEDLVEMEQYKQQAQTEATRVGGVEIPKKGGRQLILLADPSNINIEREDIVRHELLHGLASKGFGKGTGFTEGIGTLGIFNKVKLNEAATEVLRIATSFPEASPKELFPEVRSGKIPVGYSREVQMLLGVLAATHLEGGKPVSFQDLANLYFGISGIDPSKASAKLFDQLGENAPGKYRQMVNDVKFKFQVF